LFHDWYWFQFNFDLLPLASGGSGKISTRSRKKIKREPATNTLTGGKLKLFWPAGQK